jgi:ribokinase
MRKLVDVLVVNAVEAEMSGAPPVRDLASALAAAGHLAGQYNSVIVTAGAHGLAVCVARGEPVAIPARKVTVVSSHGAGDCFTGTLAAQIASGHPLIDACHAASDAAARHVAGDPQEQ